MSLLKKLEDEAHLLLQELQQHVINQVSKGNKINPKLQELLNHLEDHVNPSVAEVAVDPAPAPVAPVAVVEAPVVVEAPQTAAQAQSASNVAN